MSIIEIQGGPVTFRYLMNKSKADLAREVLTLLSLTDQIRKDLEAYKEVNEEKKKLVRELDVILNGEEGAAKQASLCDIVAQMRKEGGRRDGAKGGYIPKDLSPILTGSGEVYVNIEKMKVSKAIIRIEEVQARGGGERWEEAKRLLKSDLDLILEGLKGKA